MSRAIVSLAIGKFSVKRISDKIRCGAMAVNATTLQNLRDWGESSIATLIGQFHPDNEKVGDGKRQIQTRKPQPKQ
jgi:hypothetical protein